MTRIVSYKPLNISDDEFDYYTNVLEKSFGQNSLDGLFATDASGNITAITIPTNRSVPQVLLSFLYNIKINQELRFWHEKISKIDEIIDRLETLEYAVFSKDETN